MGKDVDRVEFTRADRTAFRNKDGTWRAKRSDAKPKPKK